MKPTMKNATLYRYTLPLNSGLILKNTTLTTREGLIVQLIENNQEGWGEIAPLPTFSRETLAEVEAAAKSWLTKWQQGKTESVENLPPSVAFGLSMALAELQGEVNTAGDFCTVPLCTNADEQTLARLADVPLAKLKIGRFSPAQDGENAARLLAQLPNLRLRLDANRAWSLAQAVDFAEKIAKPLRERIAFIEEPCRTPQLSLTFSEQTGITIAWDETTRETDFSPVRQPNVVAWVLKPTLIGSREKCLSLMKHAHTLGLQTVISSSLESSLGLSQLARLALQHSNSPAGLDTLNLMSCQLLRPFGNSNLPLFDLNSNAVQKIEIKKG